ncbi:2-hydroxychromene-2-carboxylate isomerase [Streptomyces sp. S465]|uniref:2-hydroxychromene-2-carboxylate isomerase n=1 Tax=Streptomyces sp. S465 TaxID=2979468 RepID=UPI0022A8BE96|nr:DsbA family protein [Streptomyces sp. S465]WAP56742.1 DsbA family protein [Streptomyces sp. S465]
MSRKKKHPRWYFSLRSPYSWFAYRDLSERYPDVLDAIEWIPYWEPDAVSEKLLADQGVTLPVVPMSRAKNFYILRDARRWAHARGWRVTWPVDRAPHWEVSHLAYLAAEEAGRGREFVAAAYRARWHRGLDLAERGTITLIADELGLDPGIADSVDDDRLRAKGVECLAAAYHDDAFGVPYFVNGREGFWGAERVSAFVASVRGTTWDGRSDAPFDRSSGDLAPDLSSAGRPSEDPSSAPAVAGTRPEGASR